MTKDLYPEYIENWKNSKQKKIAQLRNGQGS